MTQVKLTNSTVSNPIRRETNFLQTFSKMYSKNAALIVRAAFLKCIIFRHTRYELPVFHYNSCCALLQYNLITNVSLQFSTSIRHAAITDEELIQYQFSLSMLVVKSIENTSSIYFHTNIVPNIRIWINHVIIRYILFAFAFLLNLIRLHCIFSQCVSFLLSCSL